MHAQCTCASWTGLAVLQAGLAVLCCIKVLRVLEHSAHALPHADPSFRRPTMLREKGDSLDMNLNIS